MTDTQTSTLVLGEDARQYLRLLQATLDQGPVPEQHTVEVERLLAEADGDVSGYYVGGFIALPLALSRRNAEGALLNWIEQQLITGGPA